MVLFHSQTLRHMMISNSPISDGIERLSPITPRFYLFYYFVPEMTEFMSHMPSQIHWRLIMTIAFDPYTGVWK